jgi:hypothetical protein
VQAAPRRLESTAFADRAATVRDVSRRAAILVLAAAVPLAALGVAAAVTYWPSSLPAPLAAPNDPILPDLAMSPLTDVAAGVAPSGNQYVAFTASIGNLGSGRSSSTRSVLTSVATGASRNGSASTTRRRARS